MHVARRPHSSPASSSSSSRRRYADRFIPARNADDLHAKFHLLRPAENLPAPETCYTALLKTQLLDTPPPSLPPPSQATPTAVPDAARLGLKRVEPQHGMNAQLEHPSRMSAPVGGIRSGNLLRYSERRVESEPAFNEGFTLDVGEARKALAASYIPGKPSRKIARAPFKVLDAPCLKDDFYLNLVDWSAKNVLAVGLGRCVYLWSACTSVVTKLCDLQFGGPVCSVAWSAQGTELAVGTMPGSVQVWDAGTQKLLRTMSGHSARAGCLAWNSTILSSGSRDKDIYNRDMRCREPFVARLGGHRQEVCGLKWSCDDQQLASGGNDNKLLIWNGAGGSVRSPMLKFGLHDAAVKAIAWSPHARGLLCSGGGTADRKIRFWNTMTNSALAAVDTGSQVCNLMWSKNVNEVVSTHGYSQNQIIVWKYPSLSKVTTLMGHSKRVLYLAMSPSGETIVTGAGEGDETLRFWNVFPAAKKVGGGGGGGSKLSASRMCIR